MRLYNTPHKQIEEIQTKTGQPVTLYTCGPTVYDYPHIGNWFTFLRYDLLVRALKLSGHETKWVMNITDVGHLVSDADDGEDKLEKGAKREGKTAWEVAEFYTKDFLAGMKALNMLKPNVLPKATDHIAEQITLVEKLEANGLTYTIDDGVYFDTAKFPTYADFAGLDLKGLESGARVAVNEQKRNPSDFAVWKFSPIGEKRDMEWDSPWGKGFPGWHLECSAMSMKYLGKTLDLHAGGIDHIPVHHTNEIAQSEGANAEPFVRYWMHANHITVDGQKIAKSAGNGITLHDLNSKGFEPLVLRLLVLESHYRTQSMFSWDTLSAAKQRLQDLRAFADLRFQVNDEAGSLGNDFFEKATAQIRNALIDDLNTPEVLRILSEMTSHVFGYAKGLSPANHADLEDFLEFLDEAVGLELSTRQDITDEQRQLLDTRQQARDAKDWAKSDELRDQLQRQGIGVNDLVGRYTWYRL